MIKCFGPNMTLNPLRSYKNIFWLFPAHFNPVSPPSCMLLELKELELELELEELEL